MKAQYEAKIYITFSIDIPKKYEKLMGMTYSKKSKLSEADKRKRSDYYDLMRDKAREALKDINNIPIDNMIVDEINCNKVY